MHSRDLASLAGEETIFGGLAAEKLKRLQAELEPLSRRYDVVVANPPYMGSSSLGKWMGAWAKKHYPEAYRDLCTSFIDRGFGMSADDGYSAMVTMQSWMFLGSFEKLRGKILRNHSVSSMAHLGTRAFGAIGGEVVSTTATVLTNAKSEVKGAYFRLVDMGSEEEKQAGLLEALAHPNCGWFYRTDASSFEAIPGNPIAYWATASIISAFNNPLLGDLIPVKKGLDTGDNDTFLRLWHEVSISRMGIGSKNQKEFFASRAKWAPHDKGGEYRKWYGNKEWVINWENNGSALKSSSANLRSERYYFNDAVTWNSLSSGLCSFRLSDYGAISNTAGSSMFPRQETLLYLALMNSSVVRRLFEFLAPTLNYSAGPVGQIPRACITHKAVIEGLASDSVANVKQDWNSFETSWDFTRHPLV